MQRGVACASVYMGNSWFGVCYTSDDDCCASTAGACGFERLHASTWGIAYLVCCDASDEDAASALCDSGAEGADWWLPETHEVAEVRLTISLFRGLPDVSPGPGALQHFNIRAPLNLELRGWSLGVLGAQTILQSEPLST